MRTLVLILLFLVLAAPAAMALGSSPDEPPEALQQNASEAVEDTAAESESESAESAPQEEAEAGVAPEQEVPAGPFGEMRMVDESVLEIMNLKRFGKYYIYISGKLNGRSSMVISLTRLSDIRRWTGIAFKDQNTFTIVTKDKKELNFTDGHVYLGSDSPTEYTVMATNPSSYMEDEMSVKKSDVKLLLIK